MASESFRAAISELQEELRKQQAEVAETKRLINRLCARGGMPPMFADAEITETGNGVALSVRADQFYGQPLATAMRAILDMRRALNQGPATVNEIYATLQQGGYKFDTKNEENAKRGLRISLTKNVEVFHKLPNGTFGLTDWYPAVRSRKRGAPDADALLAELTDGKTPGTEGGES